MPRKNISDMLHRSVAGAVLFSICHFAAAEAANTKVNVLCPKFFI